MGVLEEHTSHAMYWTKSTPRQQQQKQDGHFWTWEEKCPDFGQERYGNPCASADPCQQGTSLLSTSRREAGNYAASTSHLQQPQPPHLSSKSTLTSMFSPPESSNIHGGSHLHRHPASHDLCLNNNQPLSPDLKAASSAAATESANCSPSHDGMNALSAVQPAVDALCAGCDQRIHDRFYLVAVERCWHSDCLRCSECRRTLDTATSCFARQSRIYCKDDYHRLFGVKRCAKCDHTLLPHELVMRARDWVFHVRCFSCEVCNVQLSKGDTFGMLFTSIYCKEHYSLAAAQHPHHHSHSPSNLLDLNHSSSNCNSLPSHHLNNSEGPFFHASGGEVLVAPPQALPNFHHFPPTSGAPPPFLNTFPNCGSGTFYPSNPAVVAMPFGPAAPEHFVKMNFMNNNSLLSTPTSNSGAPVKKSRKRRLKEGLALSAESGADPYAEGFSPNGSVSTGQARAKRMRTSFKHNQLRMLKSYFATNHNPDAKDLKQLSQKTSLSKRVLQVWFQNARAKWRRLMQKQDKNCSDQSSPLPSMGKAGSAPGLSAGVGATTEEQLASMTTSSHQHLHYDDMSSSSAASISFPSPL